MNSLDPIVVARSIISAKSPDYGIFFFSHLYYASSNIYNFLIFQLGSREYWEEYYKNEINEHGMEFVNDWYFNFESSKIRLSII